eukprot:768511-Hanusia_phi.AAC.5
MPLVMRKPRGGAGRDDEEEESWRKRRKSQLFISDDIMRKHFDDVGSEDGLNTREVLMLADKLWGTFMSGYPAFSYEIRKDMVKEVIGLSEKSEDKLISYEVFAEFFRKRSLLPCVLAVMSVTSVSAGSTGWSATSGSTRPDPRHPQQSSS